MGYFPTILVQSSFYTQSAYLDSMAELISAHYTTEQNDHLVFSYHGIPIQKNIKEEGISYRSQCIESTEGIAKKLGLPLFSYSTCFQSRLGRQEWTRPYAEEALQDLFKKGIRRVALVCPGFMIDCLETREEIGIELQAWWKKQGGISLTLLPCLNHRRFWVEQLAFFLSSL